MKLSVAFIALLATPLSILAQVPTDMSTAAAPNAQQVRLAYIERFKAVAVKEMERANIPASIKLAQGILESGSGTSTLSREANNHFGIKCHSDWTGGTFYKEDDDRDPVTGAIIKSCFRKYGSPEESFFAHSEFLRDPRKTNRYGFLFTLDRRDYIGWANGLQRAGYATSLTYAENLINIIEDYQLSRFDNMTSTQLPNVPTYTPGTNPNNGTVTPPITPKPQDNVVANSVGGPPNKEGIWNDVSYIKAYGGLSLEHIAGRYDVRLKDLVAFNENYTNTEAPLADGTVIYLQKKRKAWVGKEKYHKVQACETMFEISQKYAIRLAKLYSKNEMTMGEQPAVGERIILQRGFFERWTRPLLRDTAGEFQKCGRGANPATQPVTKPTNEMPEITPSNPNASTTYPSTSTTYPSTSTTYPSTSTTYPSTSTTYPSTSTTYPSTSTTYPSTSTTYPSTSTETSNYPAGTIIYPNGEVVYPNGSTKTQPVEPEVEAQPSYPSYPSYPSKPNTQPTKPSTQPTKPTTQPTRPATQPAANTSYHTVAQGETLWAISRKYNTTVEALKKLNGLTDNIIKPGQQLRVK